MDRSKYLRESKRRSTRSIIRPLNLSNQGKGGRAPRMKLTFDQLYDYARCPMVFYFKYLLGHNISANKYDQFDTAVIKAILYFYYNIMDGGTIVSSGQLKRKWESFWGQGKLDPQRFILTPMHGSIPTDGHSNRQSGREAKNKNFLLRGWSMLNNFHRTNHTNPGNPIAVDLDFEIKIGKHNIKDTLELARTIKTDNKEKTEIVILHTRQSIPTEFEIRNDLKTTFHAYVFRKIFNTNEDVITYYYLAKNRQVETIRVQRDFDRLESIIDNITRSIDLGIWFPRHTYFCHTCNLCELCSRWEG